MSGRRHVVRTSTKMANRSNDQKRVDARSVPRTSLYSLAIDSPLQARHRPCKKQLSNESTSHRQLFATHGARRTAIRHGPDRTTSLSARVEGSFIDQPPFFTNSPPLRQTARQTDRQTDETVQNQRRGPTSNDSLQNNDRRNLCCLGGNKTCSFFPCKLPSTTRIEDAVKHFK